MFTDPHIGNMGKSVSTEELEKRLRIGIIGRSVSVATMLGKMLEAEVYELESEPMMAMDDSFNSDHPNDQGERTNKKLRVQPFYHRGRNGKMRNY